MTAMDLETAVQYDTTDGADKYFSRTMQSPAKTRTGNRSYGSTLPYHRLHPEISLERYVRSKVLETADRAVARKRIYLDTRFWIALRDVRLQRPRTVVDEELLETLVYLVGTGKVICPINANIFAELIKQRDEKTRLATAQLIDELSLGIAIQPEDERIGTEIMHCLQRMRGEEALEPLDRLVWTSASYLLGYVFLTDDLIPDAEMLAWQKSFTDDFWAIPFAEQISMLGETPVEFDHSWDRIAKKINRETEKHGGTPKSFKQVHVDEFVGFLEGFLPAMRKIMDNVTIQSLGLPVLDQEQVASADDARMLLRILREAFRKNKLGTQLPSVVVKSGLYAAIRWNRRQYKGNDLHDFGHASAALFYCNYFATDAGLRHLVNDELRYDQKYAVTVVDNASALLHAIREL